VLGDEGEQVLPVLAQRVEGHVLVQTESEKADQAPQQDHERQQPLQRKARDVRPAAGPLDAGSGVLVLIVHAVLRGGHNTDRGP
jgi:hypothetical protein